MSKPKINRTDAGEALMDRVDVLDHGFVRLVDHMGSDVSVGGPRGFPTMALGALARMPDRMPS